MDQQTSPIGVPQMVQPVVQPAPQSKTMIIVGALIFATVIVGVVIFIVTQTKKVAVMQGPAIQGDKNTAQTQSSTSTTPTPLYTSDKSQPQLNEPALPTLSAPVINVMPATMTPADLLAAKQGKFVKCAATGQLYLIMGDRKIYFSNTDWEQRVPFTLEPCDTLNAISSDNAPMKESPVAWLSDTDGEFISYKDTLYVIDSGRKRPVGQNVMAVINDLQYSVKKISDDLFSWIPDGPVVDTFGQLPIRAKNILILKFVNRTNGKFVQCSTTGRLYMIFKGNAVNGDINPLSGIVKIYFTNKDWLQRVPFTTTSCELLDAIPDDTKTIDITLADFYIRVQGRLVKCDLPEAYYLIDASRKRRIAADAMTLIDKGNALVGTCFILPYVPDGTDVTAANIPNSIRIDVINFLAGKQGKFVQCATKGAIYLIDSGLRRYVTGPAWDRVTNKVFTSELCALLDMLPAGADVTADTIPSYIATAPAATVVTDFIMANEQKFVRCSTTGAIYFIDAGRKRHVTGDAWAIVNTLGSVDSRCDILDAIPEGTLFNDTAVISGNNGLVTCQDFISGTWGSGLFGKYPTWVGGRALTKQPSAGNCYMELTKDAQYAFARANVGAVSTLTCQANCAGAWGKSTFSKLWAGITGARLAPGSNVLPGGWGSCMCAPSNDAANRWPA